MRRLFLLLVGPGLIGLLCALGMGCAVRSVYLKPDFDKTDGLNLKRVGVFATPIANAPRKAAELLARMARRFIHQHKDYLVTSDGRIDAPSDWKTRCSESLHGVLRMMINSVSLDSDKVRLDMVVDLRRCDNGALVWKVEIRDTNDQRDDDLTKLAGVYEREFGEVARRYAAPFFIVVKTAFDSLPSPKLTDEETMEKISMDE